MEVANLDVTAIPGSSPAMPSAAEPPVVPTDIDSLTNEDDITKDCEVSSVAPEFLIKHPLQNVWTLWFFELVKGGDWQLGQKEITTIDTVEDFWSVYNHIKLASELKHGCDYSLFKQGIMPMWEDPRNINGGKWLFTVDRRHRANELDRIWLDLCLCLIGEGFKQADDICGSIVNIRNKQDKINLWTSDYSNVTNVLEIGKEFKEKLKLNRIQIQYIAHKDQMKAGSTPKYLYTL